MKRNGFSAISISFQQSYWLKLIDGRFSPFGIEGCNTNHDQLFLKGTPYMKDVLGTWLPIFHLPA